MLRAAAWAVSRTTDDRDAAHPGSLVAQSFDRVEPGCAPRRVEGGEEGKRERHDHDSGDLTRIDARRYAGEEIDLGGEQIGADDPLNCLPYCFDIVGEDETEDKPGDGADDPDAGAAQYENAQDHAARSAHRAQDRDVAPLVLHHHDYAGDDVEGGHDDDQCQDQEHDVALNLDRVEQTRIGLLPVNDPDPAGERRADQPALLANSVGVGGEDLEAGDRVGQAKKQLCRIERYKDKAVVVFVHANIEQRDYVVGLDARHRAESGGCSLWRNQRDRAADGKPEPAGEPVADRDAVVAEVSQRALDDVVRQQWERAQIVGP